MKLLKIQLQTKDKKLVDVELDNDRVIAEAIYDNITEKESHMAKLAFYQAKEIVDRIKSL